MWHSSIQAAWIQATSMQELCVQYHAVTACPHSSQLLAHSQLPPEPGLQAGAHLEAGKACCHSGDKLPDRLIQLPRDPETLDQCGFPNLSRLSRTNFMFSMSARSSAGQPAAAVCCSQPMRMLSTPHRLYAVVRGMSVQCTGSETHQVLSTGKKQHQWSLLLPSPASMACCSSSPSMGMS